jgi:predicted phosphodiesterase
MKRQYDWATIRLQAANVVANLPDGKISYMRLAQILNIPPATLHDNVDLQELLRDKPNFQYKISDDSIEIADEGEFPKTAEMLALAAGITLTDYNIKSFDCFARQVQVKAIDKDLTFDAGRITGTVSDHGEMNIKTIWSSRLILEPVKIKLRKFDLHPVEIILPVYDNPIGLTDRGEALATAIIPDIHFGYGEYGPFHDPIALDRTIDLVERFAVDEIVILGDILDMAEFSDKFINSPATVKSTQLSLDQCAQFLGNLRQVRPNVKITLLEGNHEFRLTNQLRKYLMALAGLHVAGNETQAISIAYFLGLDKLGIKFVDGYPNNSISVAEVEIMHGNTIGAKPGQTALKMLEKYHYSTIFGHTHRREYIETSIWSDIYEDYKTIFAYSPGCLCRTDGAVPGSSASMGWRQGVGILMTNGNGKSYIQDFQYDKETTRFLV